MRAKAIPIIDLIAKRKNSAAERIPACFEDHSLAIFSSTGIKYLKEEFS